MIKRRKEVFRVFMFVLVVLMVTAGPGQTQAQGKYPSRPIDILCPFAPGGATDLAARVVSAYLSKKWGVAVNVINKTGGNTVPCVLEVYHAAPNGYTILADSVGSSSLLPAAVKDLPFKITDRSFIAMMCFSPSVIYVKASSPFKDMKDLAEDARKSPEDFTWTSLGGTGSADFTIRQFLKVIGVDVVKTKPVVSGGSPQSAAFVAGGHVKMGSATVSVVMPAFKAGNLKLLAITGKDRDPALPNVPTTAEAGYPKVQACHWGSFAGPPKLPQQVVEVWDQALQEMLKDPEIIAKMKNIGLLPLYKNTEETREYVRLETEEVKDLWGIK